MKYFYYILGTILISVGVLLTINYPIGGWELVSYMVGLVLISKGKNINEWPK